MSDRNDSNIAPTVLIVDDEAPARRLLEAYLHRSGYTILEAASGHEALQYLTDGHIPDAVIMDIMMDGMDGLEVLGVMRQQYQPAELPVILLTALGDKKDVVRGLELGASDYVTKPVEVAELAARVRNLLRTKRLMDQNRMGIERLQELDELKNKFIQITAHDLKSPLGTIGMGLQILADAIPEACEVIPEYERIIHMMTFATNTMQSIINDYLDLEMIKAGRLDLDLQQVTLNKQVGQVVEGLRPYAESKGITLKTELDPELPICPGDPDRLMQVINNLVNNAIKFSPRGSTVIAKTHTHTGSVRVEIADSGPGISPDELPLLFTEFARLSNRPTGGEKSSGVGLAITRYLVEAHGGQIGVESMVGMGSTFWFQMPC